MASRETLDKAELATRIATAVLGPRTNPQAIEDFAVDLMNVPTERLRAIMVALPSVKDSNFIPKRTTAWARLIKPKVRL